MLEKLTTENRNDRTMNLDEMSTEEILRVMNEEDQTVPRAIQKELSQIEKLVKLAIQSLKSGGRMIYLGAGTSGRLGILDAVECVPTFGTSPEMVKGLLAGGNKAFMAAVEGAEDSEELAASDLAEINLNKNDIVIGIAASGRTPYVIGGLKFAKEQGAFNGSIACNKDAEISKYAEIALEIETGSEILTGSTRLKAGTAQKLVLNMISTATMIGIGKVYKNLMVDVQPTNLKLVERSKRIIMQAAETDEKTAEIFYRDANGDVKTAIVMILTNCSAEEARNRLKHSEGFVRKAL
ncbi:N-acetylmuramic acid 6-phosphate etherase [Bacillus sp. CECT 9360]|uniref:N-acetylmuramic acid 6-phosphate etherase n=1 Tax=Bacillus sp. CECT 9360 TaxID=2845821 RepID=UPI001E3BE60D|nr:N-acetylmuramic acid 6-phosphate etherase [Bacillus sp. CECT 9360]CAH0346969.1 N-acetylmuramic acid 6-phosphate etherase [Bacillus sp. CECT 9360]